MAEGTKVREGKAGKGKLVLSYCCRYYLL